MSLNNKKRGGNSLSSTSDSIKSNNTFNSLINHSNIKNTAIHNKPFQELNHCSYDDYLKYNQHDFIKPNDFIWKDDNLYFIIDFNKKNNKFTMINLENNKIENFIYPFYYCKIDGNDPNILYNTYLNIKTK